MGKIMNCPSLHLSKISSVVYYFTPFKSPFFSPGAKWSEKKEELSSELRSPQRSEAVGWFRFVYLLIYVYT